MPRKKSSKRIDLDFRPVSYWATDNPVSAIVQNIKGENRRRMARDFVTGQAPEALGEIHDELLADTMSPADVVSLGRLHPSFMGGEYLPDYTPGETEIARVVLQSSTQDVFSLRARRGRAPTARFRYRFVDEYDSSFVLPVKTTTAPLSLRKVIAMIDKVASDDLQLIDAGFVESWLHQQLEHGDDPEDALGFVSVRSEVYPQLGAYYEWRKREFVEAWNAEWREVDDRDEDEDEVDGDGEGDSGT